MYSNLILYRIVSNLLRGFNVLSNSAGGDPSAGVESPSAFVNTVSTTTPVAELASHSAALNVNVVDFTVHVKLKDGKINKCVDLWTLKGLTRLTAGRFSASIQGDLSVYFIGTPSATTTPPTFSGQAAIIGFDVADSQVELDGVISSIGSAPITFTAGGMQASRLALPPDVRTTTLTTVPGNSPRLVVAGSGNGFSSGYVCVTGKVALSGIGSISFF